MADYYTKLGLPKGVGNSQASAQLLSGMLVNAAASAQNIQQMSSISKNSSTSSSTVKTSRCKDRIMIFKLFFIKIIFFLSFNKCRK